VSSIGALLLDKGLDGRISLSEAVQAANRTGNVGLPDKIVFDIPLNDPGHVYYQDDGGAPGWNSTPLPTVLDDASITDFDTDLPGTPRSWYRIQYTGDIDGGANIADAVHIDATTQAGFSGEPIIELDFSLPGALNVDGLRLDGTSDGSTIRGFIFNGMQREDPIKVDTSNNKIVGNWFGLDSTGTVMITNFDNSIHLSGGSNNIIGGATAADRNVMVGALEDGGDGSIRIGNSSNNIIQGNYIGTDKTGLNVLGGGAVGIYLYDSTGSSSNNIIGGTTPGEGNIIAGHTDSGISVNGPVSAGNTISGNSIYSNGPLGIELAGGNDSQSSPSLSTAVSDGITTTVTGTLSSAATPNETIIIEFFASDSASTGEEGQMYMGSATVTTDGAGNASFTAVLSVGVTNGAKITATATNDNGSTSQFSGAAPATGPAADNAPVANDDFYTVAQDTTLDVDWWDTDWTKRQILTFDNLRQSEHLSDFPVLVKLTGGYNIDYSQTQANGEDLRFIDADGTALAYEVDEWNENGTSYVWVRVPQVDGWSNTDYILMYYGNATAAAGESPHDVWSPAYRGVWHLDETGSGAVDEFTDSSAFANHGQGGGGTGSAVPTQIANGQFGAAQEFDGANDYINAGNDASLDLTGVEVTIEAWVQLQRTVAPLWGDAIAAKDTQYGLFQDWDQPDRVTFGTETSGQAWVSDDPVPSNTWTYVVGRYDGTNMEIYRDGAFVGSQAQTGTLTSAGADLLIGSYVADGWFDGLIDEVRVSDVSRSAEWIAAQYATMTDTFVSFSGEQSAPALSGTIANDTDDDDDPLNAVLIDGPSKAANFTFNADGTFSYTPIAGYTGADSFTYLVSTWQDRIPRRSPSTTITPSTKAIPLAPRQGGGIQTGRIDRT
jgi:hypothetical protein